jgi:hypothetical protein
MPYRHQGKRSSSTHTQVYKYAPDRHLFNDRLRCSKHESRKGGWIEEDKVKTGLFTLPPSPTLAASAPLLATKRYMNQLVVWRERERETISLPCPPFETTI